VVAKGNGTVQRVSILNGRFDPLTATQAVDAVFRVLESGQRGWLCTVNVTTLMMMRNDPKLQSFVDRASLVVADGQPLVWCAPLFGHRLPERVTGIDLVDLLCKRAEQERKGVYLLGASDDLLKKAIAVLQTRYPKLQIDSSDGYFSAQSAELRAHQIRSSGAHLLFVGMGSPRQEDFIHGQWGNLGVGLAIGVGGSFDVLAGARFRAPFWMRSAGLEWLFRLLQEPRRLFPRYVINNSKFCLLMANATMVRWMGWRTTN
jgi:N-acetylglucosaminyldiphosphoundecaprenol N-acetyl-beta-D-mannosaminyltransferase